MPLGNGEVGLNVWTEPNGDLVLYVARTDAWNENARLLKLGRVRITLEPRADFAAGFRQSLLLDEGAVEVAVGDGCRLRVWVDANAPVVRVEMASSVPRRMRASLEIWRREERLLQAGERPSAYELESHPRILETPDLLLDGGPAAVLWCHRNERSMWPDSVRLQGLAELTDETDPLLYRTFGGAILGEGFVTTDSSSLGSQVPGLEAVLEIHTHTQQTPTLEEWRQALFDQVAKVQSSPVAQARAAHVSWWRDYWERSYIEVSGTPEAEIVSRGYALQRFVNACAGRGQFPIKFNGSLFTMETPEPSAPRPPGEAPPIFDADYRRWGGPYWFQNTRLIYWPMLAAGDFDLMQPLFQMYLKALPIALARTQAYFGHAGACFPETMTFWGGYADSNFGIDRTGLPVSHCVNQYIRHYWQGGLELCELGLQYFRHVGDKEFLRNTLLPLASEILRFYGQHYARSSDGELILEPAQALETWWDVVNPTPDIAALECVLEGLLELPAGWVPEECAAEWLALKVALPPMPRSEAADGEVIAAAAEIRGEIRNMENPELYAVFPYRRFGLGLPELELARNTFQSRRYPETGCWSQNAIQAAYLGLVAEARDMVVKNFSASNPRTRFPAFWGPNHDWLPDQDHGGVAMMALQAMLFQQIGGRRLLLPAWPQEWNVRFRLHATGGSLVEGEFHDGELVDWKVTPSEAEELVDVCVMRRMLHGEPEPVFTQVTAVLV